MTVSGSAAGEGVISTAVSSETAAVPEAWEEAVPEPEAEPEPATVPDVEPATEPDAEAEPWLSSSSSFSM